MFLVLLLRRYLTTKVMPLLAALAVALCTAMVLIVWSVMGGFLTMLVSSGRVLVGDISITWPNSGFAHYDDLIERLERDPAFDAAAPLIESYGLVHLPNDRNETVLIKGIDGRRFARVTSYADTLWWKPIDEPLPKDRRQEDWRLRNRETWTRIHENGLTLTRVDPRTGERRPAIVPGIEVTGFNIREPGGWFTPGVPIKFGDTGRDMLNVIMPVEGTVTLNVLALDSKGRQVDTVSRVFPVANEFHSGLFEMDRRTVFVELGALQKMLKMDRARRLVRAPGPETGAAPPPAAPSGVETFDDPAVTLADDPARVTTVLARGRPGVALSDLREAARRVYTRFAADHAGQVPDAGQIVIQTWEDQNRTLIQAVKKETYLVLFIFGFISLTAVFLVLAIFWAMVSEKTRDVGVLRAIGAGRAGVAGVWLVYGLLIGIAGVGLGLGLAWLIVRNINEIHEWLGATFDLMIWDPRIYYFTRIPTDMSARKVAFVLGGGVLSSVVGAIVPAIRAAHMQPVRALRYE